MARSSGDLSFPFRNRGCPALACKGGYDADDTMGFVMPSGLHRTYVAHPLHFITCSCYRRLPLLKPRQSRDCFPGVLEQARVRCRFVVVGYVACPSLFTCSSSSAHLHLLNPEPEIGRPSKVMQTLKQRFAIMWRRKALAKTLAAGVRNSRPFDKLRAGSCKERKDGAPAWVGPASEITSLERVAHF